MAYEALATALKQALEGSGLSERKACLRAGLHVDAVRRIREGREPKLHTLQRLAAVLHLRPDYLVSLAGLNAPGRRAGPIPLEQVFVRGDVQAGVWREAIEWEGSEWYSITTPSDDRFPGLERFGLEVRGASMDRLYPEGTIVIVVRFSDLARGPETGERVVCLRRSGTGEFEATIKQYELDPRGRHLLWPRSTDPEFQQPFVLSGDLPVTQGYEPLPATVNAGYVEAATSAAAPDLLISGLVIQSVRRE